MNKQITSSISITHDPIMIREIGMKSAKEPKTAIPMGRKSEYIVPSSPNTRPCMLSSAFSWIMVVTALCIMVKGIPYSNIKPRYSRATLLDEHEDAFAEGLEKKSYADSIRKKKLIENELQTEIFRNERVASC